MSEPAVAYRRERVSFSLGLAAVSAAVLFTLGWGQSAGLDGYTILFVYLVAVPIVSVAIGGFFACLLAERIKGQSLGARLLRVVVLTLVAPLIAFLIAALGMYLGDPIVLLGALTFGPEQFVVPALVTTLGWSLFHVFVVRPWLSR